MPVVEERTYRFTLSSHWGAGVRRGLRIQDDGLVVPHPLEVRPLTGTGTKDGNAAPAVDSRDRILWLRPGTSQLQRWHSDDLPSLGQGTLEGASGGRRLLIGPSVTWVAVDGGLQRYDTATAQRLTPPLHRRGWHLSDATGDENDGVWITESDGAHRWWLRHLNCWGQTCLEPVVLTGVSAEHLVVATDANGTEVIALNPGGSSELIVVKPKAGTIHHVVLDVEHRAGRSLMSAGAAGRVRLLTVPDDFGRDNRKVLYQEIETSSGAVEDHQHLAVPRELGQPTVLAGNATRCVLAGTRGLAELVAVPTSDETRRATFITPALISPLAAQSGWDRADLDALLPAGTTMEVTWAATSEMWLADRAVQVMADTSTPGMVSALEQQLPWRPPGTLYRGDDGGQLTYGALLNRVESTLWLRIELRIAAGSTVPQLRSLRVHYPNTSYLDHLPAIYRVNQRSVEDLRQILAPYEVLLDGIDKRVDELPERLDPASADDEWTEYILGWLGFPPLNGLDPGIRQGLLASAADLLDARGTRMGLEKLLGVLTKGRYTLTDSSEEPAGWFLGAGTPTPTAGAGPSRLGVDTVVLKQLPQPDRLGAMVLGAASLGYRCTDGPTMLAQRGGALTIKLHVGRDRQSLEPLLERLLDAFVPAHCLLRVLWTGTPEAQAPRLDDDFRLAPDSSTGTEAETSVDALLHDDDRLRLGTSTLLGGWPLPTRANQPPVLDHNFSLGADLRLL
jgi:phage tail-like protein